VWNRYSYFLSIFLRGRGHNARLVTSRNGGAIEHPGSYMALFPTSIQNSDFSIYFKLLKPVAYETVEARLLFSNYSDSGEKNVTKASGSLSLSSGNYTVVIVYKIIYICTLIVSWWSSFLYIWVNYKHMQTFLESLYSRVFENLFSWNILFPDLYFISMCR
jgi:hypothetical protein